MTQRPPMFVRVGIWIAIGMPIAIPCLGDDMMLRVDVQGNRVEGKTLFYSRDRVQMLLRDGQLLDFPTSQARNFQKSATSFRGYTAGELRRRLASELGKNFEVSGTGHYLVAHPRGQRDLWAPRFESLYRDFVHYFSVRGRPLDVPEYPLVAVVWTNEPEFRRDARRNGTKIASNVLGYYSPLTNRVSLYDRAADARDKTGWRQNAHTIIHEVTHQTAFNTGIHARFAKAPLWVVEGLGTLFEARGVHRARVYPNRADRLNQGRLRAYHTIQSSFEKGFLVDLISSDRVFDRDPGRAYALAWALTFYLVETQPRRYGEYLSRTAQKKPGRVYPTAARVADFTAVFGDRFAMLEAQFTRFMRRLP